MDEGLLRLPAATRLRLMVSQASKCQRKQNKTNPMMKEFRSLDMLYCLLTGRLSYFVAAYNKVS